MRGKAASGRARARQTTPLIETAASRFFAMDAERQQEDMEMSLDLLDPPGREQLLRILRRFQRKHLDVKYKRRSFEELKTRDTSFLIHLIKRNKERAKRIQRDEVTKLAKIKMLAYTSSIIYRAKDIFKEERQIAVESATMMLIANEALDALAIVEDRGQLLDAFDALFITQ